MEAHCSGDVALPGNLTESGSQAPISKLNWPALLQYTLLGTRRLAVQLCPPGQASIVAAVVVADGAAVVVDAGSVVETADVETTEEEDEEEVDSEEEVTAAVEDGAGQVRTGMLAGSASVATFLNWAIPLPQALQLRSVKNVR